MSPTLAQEIVIDHERREIRIDGDPVPWFIARQQIDVVVGEAGAVSTVLLPVLARNVRVIGTPDSATEPSFEDRNTLTTGTTCRSCSKPIAWFMTPSNKRLPVDPVPTATGNVVIDAELALVLSADALAKLDVWTPRYTSHFATCPEADSWRGKGGAQ